MKNLTTVEERVFSTDQVKRFPAGVGRPVLAKSTTIDSPHEMPAIEYRPALDGLRAIAVIAVMLYHLDASLLPGGFVGVDVFFVLSGYLITSIILVEQEAKSFSYARFYQRRIARIFPAAILVIVAVLVTASVLYSPQDFASAGAVAVAAALSVANMKLMLQGSYFEVSHDAQPLLHFWSLAIEEQFYLLLPLVIGMAFRCRSPRRTLKILLGIGALASLAACITLTYMKPTWAFYLLPTRAWELLAGCLLALAATRESTTVKTKRAGTLKLIGLVLIAISCVSMREGTHFPGIVALAPVLGAVFCIGRYGSDDSACERLLSHPVLVAIGKASYSLYLWHWPVYCFVDYSLFAESALLRLSLKCTLTILLATIVFRFYEAPLRRLFNTPNRRTLSYVMFAMTAACVVMLGTWIRRTNYVNASAESVRDGGISINPNVDQPRIVLMGDSNGSMYGVTISEIATEMGGRAHIISVAAGDPLPPAQQFQDSLDFLESERPEVLVVVAAWAQKIGHDHERLLTALPELLQRAEHVVLVTQPPVLPVGTSRARFRELGLFPVFEDSESSNLRRETNEFLMTLASARVHVVDVEDCFVQSNGEIRFVDESGNQLWHDRTHLSGHGTALVKELLAAEIQQHLAIATNSFTASAIADPSKAPLAAEVNH